jgi:hypothetical protein
MEQAPKGKRSIRKNVWGNWVGYVAGKRWEMFGDDLVVAKHWLETGEVDPTAAWLAS